MTTTALTRVDTSTGEVLPSFDMTTYLQSLKSNKHFEQQQALAGVYDAACSALIGPNDVQVEGNRSFKKKSAWRKLARHFGISTTIEKVEREDTASGDFLATVTVRAVAPWGQHAEAVGACGTDEATGRRTITRADAIATAETRATNRAVSNLIAMGEVSAEEIGDRKAHGGGDRSAPVQDGAPSWPFGKKKGQPLSDADTDEIMAALDWCEQKEKKDWAALLRAEAGRRGVEGL